MFFQGNFNWKELACSFQEYSKNTFSNVHSAALPVDGRGQFWVMKTGRKKLLTAQVTMDKNKDTEIVVTQINSGNVNK